MMNFTETAVKDHSAEQAEPQLPARTLPTAVQSHPGLSSSEEGTRMQQKWKLNRDPPSVFAQHWYKAKLLCHSFGHRR